jgi:hypothetical protein
MKFKDLEMIGSKICRLEEWKQIRSVTVIKNFMGRLSGFFAVTGKWNLVSGKS